MTKESLNQLLLIIKFHDVTNSCTHHLDCKMVTLLEFRFSDLQGKRVVETKMTQSRNPIL
jgi:hypothetical protein